MLFCLLCERQLNFFLFCTFDWLFGESNPLILSKLNWLPRPFPDITNTEIGEVYRYSKKKKTATKNLHFDKLA